LLLAGRYETLCLSATALEIVDFMTRTVRFPAWVWWIIGALTILAVSILIFSVVLGIRAGQEQVEIQRRQQIGIALQRATDFQSEGNLQAALDEYQKILILDSTNDIAQQGIKNLLALATGDDSALAASAPTPMAGDDPGDDGTRSTSPLVDPAAPTMAPAGTTPTPSSALAAAWENAQRAARAGRWQEALTDLLQIQQSDPTYNAGDVQDMLITAYTNLAMEKDNADSLEEALAMYDKALALRPTAKDIQQERDLIAQYLDVLAYTGVDLQVLIRRLQALYTLDADYRDIEERLHKAHVTYADRLASDEEWCDAQDEYNAALMVASSPTVVTKRDAAQTQCQLAGAAEADAVTGVVTTPPASTTAGNAASAGSVVQTSSSGGPSVGRLLYSSTDSISGRSQIMTLPVGKGATAQMIIQDAAQPSMRSDGSRLAYRNLRNDMAGISGYDPASGLQLRFSNYAEDALPSWNSQGNRIVFASNREGDRRWRIYLLWAEENGGTDTLGFGESPNWHPSSEQIVYRGCDESGNRCGLWTISSSGANSAQLTATPADERPQWAPSGNFVAFMSNARDGNYEIYRVDVTSREVTRLTESTSIDVLPTVSPDGRWIAFVSNRDGSWKIYAVPSTGGELYLIAPVIGDMSRFLEHGMEWVN
jgi:TolB protein